MRPLCLQNSCRTGRLCKSVLRRDRAAQNLRLQGQRQPAATMLNLRHIHRRNTGDCGAISHHRGQSRRRSRIRNRYGSGSVLAELNFAVRSDHFRSVPIVLIMAWSSLKGTMLSRRHRWRLGKQWHQRRLELWHAIGKFQRFDWHWISNRRQCGGL